MRCNKYDPAGTLLHVSTYNAVPRVEGAVMLGDAGRFSARTK